MPKLQRFFMLTDKGYKDLKGAILACTLTNMALMLPFAVTMQVIREMIKPFEGGEISITQLWILFGFGVVAAVVVFFASRHDYKKTYISSYLEAENTRTSIAEHIRRLPMSVFNSKDLTELTTNMMADVATSEHVLSHVVPQICANGISITVICAMLAVFDWRLALAAFITVPVAFLMIFASRKLQARWALRQLDAKLTASGQVQEYLEGIKVIKACNMDGERFSSLDKALKKMRDLAMKFEVIAGIPTVGAQMVLQAGVGLTVLVGVTLLTGGQVGLLTMLMFVLLVARIYGPILVELTLLPEFLYHRHVVERMRRLREIEPMSGEEKVIDDYTIEFDDVGFAYNKGKEKTIDGVSFTVPANGITALVGPSGSGKSTISRLIARFWDVDEGSVRIGGVDVKTVDPEHLMGYMSFVFQDVQLFNDTVLNNIRIGRMDASREEVIAAARAAHCDKFIEKLPGGYDTVLGENGSTLSGGERQRLSIARALLKDAPIVLLDEATASLDPENEVLIQQAISRLIKGKTVIVIAHRLRTIAEADKIVVLDKGRLVQQGTHEELMGAGGLYCRLYNIQQESLGWSVGP